MLLFVNLFTIFLAIFENWNVLILLWIYWSQSVILGIFTALKLATAKSEIIDSFREQYLKETGKNISNYRVYSVFGFIFAYGFFHCIYALFIHPFSVSPLVPYVDWLSLYSSVGLFFVNHLFSFIYAGGGSKLTAGEFKSQMTLVFLRIIPMHATIILSIPGLLIGFILALMVKSIFGWDISFIAPLIVLAFFMLLKTLEDVIMELVERSGTYDVPGIMKIAGKKTRQGDLLEGIISITEKDPAH
jgi:hypothetical protein